tara:strand:+ start:1758 stop:1988 length:231 start_codon:yes stop_codon:yes gene_type:complete
MSEKHLLSVRDAAQFLFGDYDRSHQDKTRRLINQLNVKKIVIGKKTFVVKKQLADKLEINLSAETSDKVVKLKDRG